MSCREFLVGVVHGLVRVVQEWFRSGSRLVGVVQEWFKSGSSVVQSGSGLVMDLFEKSVFSVTFVVIVVQA